MSASIRIAAMVGLLTGAGFLDAQTTPSLEQGLLPYQVYEAGNIDHVNMGNGNLFVRIPLVSYPQRGSLKLSFSLVSNNKGWAETTNPYTWEPSGSLASFILVNDHAFSGGITRGCKSGVLLTLLAEADGTTHIEGITSGSPSGPCTKPSTVTLETADGSGMKVLAGSSGGLGSVTDRDGVLYGGIGTGEDPNGNEITWSLTTDSYTDSVGRVIPPATGTANYTGCTGPLPISGASLWTIPAPGGGTETFKFCYATVSIQTDFGDPYIAEFSGTESMLQSVVLPNLTTWTFAYDNYGDLTEIVFPTGGVIMYAYTNAQSNGSVTPFERVVTSRSIYDQTGWHAWNYTWGNLLSGTATNISTDPLGNDTEYTNSCLTGWSWQTTQTQTFQGSHTNGTLLQTVNTDWSLMTVNGSPYTTTAFPIRETLIWPNGQTKKVERDYDSALTWVNGVTASYGNVVQKREYDYGNGSPGALLRASTASYLAFSNSTYLNNNMLSLRSQVAVFGGAAGTGTCASNGAVSCTTFGYDEQSLHSSGVTTQHDSAPPAGSARGNQTSANRWLNTAGAYLTTSNQYFDTGMIYTSADPANNTTTYAYSPSFAGAYVTSVTDPMGHVTSYGYDFNTGLRTSVTDVNGQTTSYSYDSMWRNTQVTYPTGGGSATFTYVDSTPPTATLNRTVSSSVNYVETALLDGLGRLQQTQLTSDPDGTTKVDTTYDADGRKASVSNPYRSTGDSTYGTTSFAYDALDRVTSVTSPSGGSVTTSYTGNCATVTDQQLKPRETCTDGLGRLAQVFEPDPVSGSLINETVYAYNALDDLLQVQQEGNNSSSANWRTRTFTYDSFSRLLTASNPETGTTTYTYNYGADKLLSSKVDARGIATNYTNYDGDLRLLAKAYSDTTHAVGYGYDASACLGQPSCYNVHHRTSMTDGAGSEAWAYDAMGRTLADQRTTASLTNTFTYGYTNDGSVNSITYPSGHAVTYDIKGALRPDWAEDTGSGINYATAITYWPQGALETATYGGVIGRNDTYNNRLQPASLTANVGSTTLLSLNYSFTDTNGHNNGNVMGITNELGSTRSFTYSYDQLNRLNYAATSLASATYTTDIWANLYSISLTGSPPWQNSLSVGILPTNRISGNGYDLAGNTTADGLYSYVYDAEGRQISAAGVSYTYDGDGKRVQKSNGTLYWYGAGSEPLLETNSGGALQNEYVLLGGKRAARRDSTNAVYYYLEDHLGTSRVIATSTGSKCYDADYGPYGQEAVYASTCPQNYKFTGKIRDTETNNDYFGARFYESNFGRFMTPDWAAKPTGVPYAQFGDPQTLNLYSYTRNNPMSKADLDGHCAEAVSCSIEFAAGGSFFGPAGTVVGAIAGAAVGGVIGYYGGKAIVHYMQRSNSGTSSNSTSDSAAAATPKEGSAQPDKAGKDFSKGTKDQARKESGNKCVLCGKDTTGEPGPDQSNIDHAIPKSRGGDNTIDNAQNTCRTCNLEKGTKTTQEYMNTKPSQPPPPQAPPPPPEPEPPPPRPPR